MTVAQMGYIVKVLVPSASHSPVLPEIPPGVPGITTDRLRGFLWKPIDILSESFPAIVAHHLTYLLSVP